MTCQPVGDDNWMVPYECTLGQCKNCPKLPTVAMEDSRIGNNSIGMVTYRENCIVYYCDKHNVTGFDSKCYMCAIDNIPAGERPRIQSKDTVVLKKLTVGEFKSTVYVKQLRAYFQHRFVRKVLGKTWSLGQRETIALENPGSVLCHRDYTTRLPMIPNKQVMGQGMTGTPVVGMEGMVVRVKDEIHDNQQMHWYGWLSDEKQQDARTSFINTCKLIDSMQTLNCLRPNQDEVLYIVSDGCAKQYKCANALQTYIWLANMYRISIDVMVTAPYHGKSLVDALAGLDKTVLKQFMIHGLDSATRDENNNEISQAQVCLKVLSSPERKYGDKTDTKHKRKEDRRLHERH